MWIDDDETRGIQQSHATNQPTTRMRARTHAHTHIRGVRHGTAGGLKLLCPIGSMVYSLDKTQVDVVEVVAMAVSDSLLTHGALASVVGAVVSPVLELKPKQPVNVHAGVKLDVPLLDHTLQTNQDACSTFVVEHSLVFVSTVTPRNKGSLELHSREHNGSSSCIAAESGWDQPNAVPGWRCTCRVHIRHVDATFALIDMRLAPGSFFFCIHPPCLSA